MSGPAKRHAGDGAPARSPSPSAADECFAPNEEIQVDFEGKTPLDTDFHGIKTLLQQLFLKAHVNLSDLSNLIIGQNYIGSVIKQAEPDFPEEDEDPEDAYDVFGITTIVPIDHSQENESIHHIRELLTNLTQEHATDSVKNLIQKVLSSNSALLLNERLVNIPPQISPPLFETLREELHKATERKIMKNLDYFILISKMYKPDLSKSSNKKNKQKDMEIIWSNAEEECLVTEALGHFEFTVKTESDSGLTGNWLEEDVTMVPYRKVLIFDGKKFNSIVETIKAYLI